MPYPVVRLVDGLFGYEHDEAPRVPPAGAPPALHVADRARHVVVEHDEVDLGYVEALLADPRRHEGLVLAGAEPLHGLDLLFLLEPLLAGLADEDGRADPRLFQACAYDVDRVAVAREHECPPAGVFPQYLDELWYLWVLQPVRLRLPCEADGPRDALVLLEQGPCRRAAPL